MTVTAVSATVANGAALGTTPPAATINGSDQTGLVNLGSGTSPTAGTLCTLTLGATYTGIDHLNPILVRLTPQNAATAALGCYVSSVSNGRVIVIGCTTAPTASQAASTYQLAYDIAVTN